jgi:hypothetical protein
VPGLIAVTERSDYAESFTEEGTGVDPAAAGTWPTLILAG